MQNALLKIFFNERSERASVLLFVCLFVCLFIPLSVCLSVCALTELNSINQRYGMKLTAD